MEPALVALIVLAWILLDVTIVAGLLLVRLRGERRVRHAGQQLAAEAERYATVVGAERAAAARAAALQRARERKLSAQRR